MAKRKAKSKGAVRAGVQADLAAAEGFERVRVVDDAGLAATPQRRVDNLKRLERAIGADRVAVLRLLRDAADACEVGAAGRSALDTSPRCGSLEDAIGYRIDAARRFDAAWAAVPEADRVAVQRVVLDGWGVHRAAAERGGRIWRVQQRINGELAHAADAIISWLDRRYGKARAGWTWDADEARGEVRTVADAA